MPLWGERMSFEAVPENLKERDYWICWREETRDGKKTKVPINPETGRRASTTNENDWCSFEEATSAHAGEDIDTAGVGFVFTERDTVAGIDLDDCRNPATGEPTTEAVREIIEECNSYTEVSTSGTGYHIYLHGFVPEEGNRGDIDDTAHIEIYDKSRFFVVTGDHVDGTPQEATRRNDVVKAIHEEYVADDTNDDNSGQCEPTEPVSLDNEELLEKAKADDKFQRLWNGDLSMHSGDHSRADLALCSKLAFWTGGDRQRIERLFSRSVLGQREKWNDREDYRERTISEALSDQTEFYEPDKKPAKADGGTATASPTTPEPTAGRPVLSPSNFKVYAQVGEEESISDIPAYEQASHVWKLIKKSDDVHVRVNRDNGELWAFDGDTGTWEPNGERALRHAARKALHGDNYSKRVSEELKADVRGDPQVEVSGDTFGLEAGKLAVENGLLDLEKAYNNDDDALRELKPTDYALSRLPVEYDPEADQSEWNGFVGDVVGTSMIHTLQEYIGYCLHRESLYERALLLVGEGANGKSTFLNTIEAMLGTDNTTSVSPFDFGNKNSLARMHGSMANIAVELDGGSLQGKNLSNFKNLTGDDPIQAEQKYKDPFNFHYDGGMLFATNEVPNVNVADDDTAFWRRWIIVPFDNHFPEGSDKRDPTLGTRLKEEHLSAVLNWAIEGWGRLKEQGEFSNVPSRPDKTRRRWQSWGDSVEDFLSNVAEYDDDAANITTSEAWEVYRSWCRENGRDAVGQRKFTNAAKSKALGYAKSVRTDRHRSPHNGYKFFGTVESEENPLEVIESNSSGNDDDRDDDGHNSGLHEYGEEEQSATHADESGSEAGDSDDDPKGENGENTPTEADESDIYESEGWGKLLAEIGTHYSQGEEVTPEALAERVGITELYAKRGLEALADDGTIGRQEEGIYTA